MAVAAVNPSQKKRGGEKGSKRRDAIAVGILNLPAFHIPTVRKKEESKRENVAFPARERETLEERGKKEGLESVIPADFAAVYLLIKTSA